MLLKQFFMWPSFLMFFILSFDSLGFFSQVNIASKEMQFGKIYLIYNFILNA